MQARAALRHRLFDQKTAAILWTIGLGLLAFCFFAFLSGQIDFHPDETIYFDGIPTALRNDTGLFYSLFYQLFLRGDGGPGIARLASAALGAGTLACLLILGTQQNKPRAQWLLAAAVFLLSYQSIFIFDRVRPEAAWWFLSAACAVALNAYGKRPSTRLLALVGLAYFLLPMNHRLCWLPALFLAGYTAFFFWPRFGFVKTAFLGAAMLSGVLVNLFGRALFLGIAPTQALQAALDTPHPARPSVYAFLHNVFWDAPSFLNDTAANPNFYAPLAHLHLSPAILSHNFVQTALWLSMVILPFCGQSARARYLLSFPLFACVVLYVSGYFNPTYTAGFSLFCVIAALFLMNAKRKIVRGFAFFLIAISLFNGLSFLATRVLNHGRATYFQAEQQAHQILMANPQAQTVAISERYQSATRGFKGKRYIVYKDELPQDLDLLIVDSYDDVMYQFVPAFQEKQDALHRRAATSCKVAGQRDPVYQDDTLFPEAKAYLEMHAPIPYPGSWFFRNSAAYGLNIYKPCP